MARTRYSTHCMLIVICFVLGFPALYALLVATMTAGEAFQYPPRLLPSDDLIGNLETLFDPDKQNFQLLIRNTLAAATIVVIGKTLTSMMAGLAFVYFRFPGKWVVFFFVLLTLLMPTEIIIVPLFKLMFDLTNLFEENGLEGIRWNNSLLSITAPFLASATGAFLFRQHFSNIPRELLEAAQLDGANPIQFMFYVLIPMSWNVIGAMAVIQFIYMWNQYLWPVIILQDSDHQLVQQGLKSLEVLGGQTDFGVLMAGAVVASLPPVIVFILLQRQFMSGFSLTRDK